MVIVETQKRGAKATASLLQSHLPSVTTSVWPWPQAAHTGQGHGEGVRVSAIDLGYLGPAKMGSIQQEWHQLVVRAIQPKHSMFSPSPHPQVAPLRQSKGVSLTAGYSNHWLRPQETVANLHPRVRAQRVRERKDAYVSACACVRERVWQWGLDCVGVSEKATCVSETICVRSRACVHR